MLSRNDIYDDLSIFCLNILKYQTSSSSSLNTLGFSKTELEKFTLLISSKKSSVSMNIVSRNTESHNLRSHVQLKPTNFSLW